MTYAPTLPGLVRCVRVVILAIAATAVLLAAAARRGADDDLASLSGRALVKRLENPATRARAFHELWMRADGRRTRSFEDFAENHRDIELVVCPQGGGRGPIYLLLYDFLPEFSPGPDRAYPIANPEALFPPEPDSLPSPKREPAIDAFTSSGRRIDPFDGNDVLDGTLADINADGRVERVETARYAVDGIANAEVLHVWVVEEKARPILSVLINWGAEEWACRVRDQDGDGVSEIEIGPRIDGRFSPEVVFIWDARTKAYRGPVGRDGDHFRVLDPDSKKTESLLKALHASGFTFPAEPGDPVEVAATPRPYSRRFLENAGDDELLRLMGSGPNAYERERSSVIKNQLPPGFWKLDPKAAALALAELNRTEAHRRRFRLAIDERDGGTPPAAGSLALTSASSRCYVASDAHYFLRFSAEESYLASARSSSGGAVFYNIVSDRPSVDLRLCPLPYEDARHLAAAIWWLDRVRSRSRTESSGRLGGHSFSTADGFAELVFRDENENPLFEKSDTRWAAELSERWTEDYNPEVFLNFSNWLVSDALVDHLGETWAQSAPPPAGIAHLQGDRGPLYSPGQLDHVSTLATRFLSLAAQTPPGVSPGVASVAAEAVGDLALAYAEPVLRRLLASNPKLREQTTEALRKIETARNPAALKAWAEARQPGSQWALRQLAERDPAVYARLLEAWLAAAERPREGRQLFREIARVAPARATALARELPPEKRRALVPAELLLRDAPGEAEGVAELIAVLLDPASGWEQRHEAVAALVPEEQPLRHARPEVDAALLRALVPDMADDTVNFTCVAACRALALRGRTEHFDRIGELFRNGRDTYSTDELIRPLVTLARADPERLIPRLAALLAPHLVSTNRRMSEILWAIWAADLREFKPRLEELSTSGPEEYEDSRAVTSGGEISPVKGRFHLARKITAVWNERDARTRARLLAAFALQHIHDLDTQRLERVRDELAGCVRELDSGERERLANSFDDLLALGAPDDVRVAQKTRAALSELFRAVLAAP